MRKNKPSTSALPRASGSIEDVPIGQLRPAALNPRRHSRAQIEKIARSFEQFGFVLPVLADDQNELIAGEGRWQAAKALGLATLPVLRVRHLTRAQRRAYLIADNRIAELAEWDPQLLTMELKELMIEAPDLDLTVTGFEVAEIDRMVLGDEASADEDAADQVPPLQADQVVSRQGDLWLLDEHRLLIGDARDARCYDQLLDGQRADAGFSDPPYNVRIPGHARRGGSRGHKNFPMACGELSEAEFIAFLKAAFERTASASRPGAVHYVCIDWRHLFEALCAGREVYDALLNLCVWDKETGGMGSFYRSQHELVLVWRRGGGRHSNNVALGKFGRNRTNIWRHPGANSFGNQRADMLSLHPTVKPTALVAGAILDSTGPGDLVLDPFLGSGTTIIAAQKTGRRAAGLELDPAYGDVIIRRFERFSGISAKHAHSGRSFEAEACARGAGAKRTGRGLKQAQCRDK